MTVLHEVGKKESAVTEPNDGRPKSGKIHPFMENGGKNRH
jgi:hypothetical protein